MSDKVLTLAKAYRNSNDEPRTIHQMVGEEPEWAAVRIQEGEKAIAKLEAMDGLRRALKNLLADTQHADHNCGEAGCPVDEARDALHFAELAAITGGE